MPPSDPPFDEKVTMPEKPSNTEKEENVVVDRRKFLRGVATIPAVGAFSYVAYREGGRKEDRLQDLGVKSASARQVHDSAAGSPQDTIRVGIIGTGIRGKLLMVAAGFAQPHQLLEGETLGTDGQQPLNIRITGVCDAYKPYLDWGVEASGGTAKPYRDYRQLLESPEVDAVIIATPDHWHAPMTIAAAQAGKHVYVEKCFTHKVPETIEAVQAVKDNQIVLQLGHQFRSSPADHKAKEIVQNGLLGHISLIHTFTNRNTPDGAWLYSIPSEAGPHNVDWSRFLGNAPPVDFDLARFFQWRRYRDYGTGLSGDMFSHDWDIVDLIMGDLGIPATAVASGGIYYWKDGREVPDLYQVVYEYPDRGLTLVYNATLSNSWKRNKLFLGSDATMDLTEGIQVYADSRSKRFRDVLEKGDIEVDRPIVSYLPGGDWQLEAVTSATRRWTLAKGLLYTITPSGEVVNTSYLHLRDWFDSIREGRRSSCHEDIAFREAITAHMGTLSLKWGCRVRWDAQQQQVVPDLHIEQVLT